MVIKKIKNTKPKAKAQKTSFRPPVVAVLGHIDHGKTTLLDFVRKTNVTAEEHGGITQHLGAYQVKVKTKEGLKTITFIDTPGHEAFAKMRSRGGQVADIVLLVIAINDGVMPQTKESIKHIKEASVPVVVVINKIDLFSKKSEKEKAIEKIKKDLSKENIKVEDYGGEVVVLPISSKTGNGVDELLEMLLLVAEMKGIKGDPDAPFKGVVIESKLDSKRGVVASILVKNGSLRVGNQIIVENKLAKIRALFDEHGQSLVKAGPSKAVEVLGFSQVPPIGSQAQAVAKEAQRLEAEKEMTSAPSLIPTGPLEKKLKIILKSDALGSQEAIVEALGKKVEIVFKGVGEITESDVFLAKTIQAVILGFNIRLPARVARLAEEEKIKIKIYNVIYRLLDEIKEAVKFLEEGPKEKILGKGEIIAEFPFKKLKIAGLRVIEGRIAKGDKIKIVRNENEVGHSRIKNLRQGKEDTNKAEQDSECGVLLDPQLDFLVGDEVKSIG